MSTCQLNQQRLKCGEVFIWDCVGELFAIECLLCEERPLCTLTEFAEHMDVWHYDWTAEAYTTLPDMPDTTTMSDDGDGSNLMYASSAAPTEPNESLSDFGEFEDEFFIKETKSIGDVANESNESTTTTTTRTTTNTPSIHTRISSVEPFVNELEFVSADDNSNNITTTTTTNTIRDSLRVPTAVQNDAEELSTNNVERERMTVIVPTKQVEKLGFGNIYTTKLIESYKKYPELWHTQHRNESNTEVRTKAYLSISLELNHYGINLKPTEVQSELDALHKIYCLEKFQKLKSHSQDQLYKSSFELYEQLDFLKDHVETQMCKVCKQIHIDVGEYCLTSGETVRQGENIEDYVRDRQGPSKMEFNDNDESLGVEVEKHIKAAEVNVTGHVEETAEHSIANKVDVNTVHGCDTSVYPPIGVSGSGSTKEEEVTYSVQQNKECSPNATSVSMPTLVSSDVYPFQPNIGHLEQSAMTVQQSIFGGNELGASSTTVPVQQTFQNEIERALTQNGEPHEVSFVQHSFSGFEQQQTEHQEIPLVQQGFSSFEQQQTLLVESNPTEIEPQEMPNILPSVGKTDAQEICFIQNNDTELEVRENLHIQLGAADYNPQDTLFVQPNVPEQEFQETQQSSDCRKSGKRIEILEVLELPNANITNPQIKVMSTSNEVEATSARSSQKCLKSSDNADENMASEEYDSSNGDSGILQDCAEPNNDKEPNEDKNKKKLESFARLTTEQARHLIEIYKEYPIFWDPYHPDFSARARRRKAWIQVTTKFNELYKMRYNWTTVHRKMHDYMKYYKRERQRIETEGAQTRWFFFDDFVFLNEVLDEQSVDAKKLWLSRVQNQKLIEEYSKHPQLWDTNHKEFKRRCLRQAIFKKISEKLRNEHNISLTPLKVRQRIVEFRSTYRMEKERRFTAQQQGEHYTPTYDYFIQLNFLDEHVAPFVCTICGVQYKKHKEIERHIKQKHINAKTTTTTTTRLMQKTETPSEIRSNSSSSSLTNICYICGMSFTLRRYMMSHLKRHKVPPAHACNSCTKRFYDAATLRIHERTHSKSRPFVCEQCGARYTSGSKLNQHLKRHTNQRDHPCKVCGKAFYSAFECGRHMRTHQNIREKVCTICGKDFSVGSSYYAHMLLHAERKRYKCEPCDREFAQFAGLYKHRKRHHPKEFAMEKAQKAGIL